MHWKDITNNLKRSNTQKIQLMIAIEFLSFWDNDQEHIMHSKVNNIEIMINVKADEVIEELFKSIEKRYQIKLDWKHQQELAILSLIMFIYCITDVIKWVLNELDHI